jgi:gluconokinase
VTTIEETLGDGPRHIVVMGVSGCGKTTVALGLSAVTGSLFAEADDFHSAPSIERMRAGVPLQDADREPWLRSLATWLADRYADGTATVLACSALRRAYRDILRGAGPGLEFVHLHGLTNLIRERLLRRTDHYMPASLLDSQLAALEPLQPDEQGIVLDAALSPEELVTAVITRLDLGPQLTADNTCGWPSRQR